MAETLLSCPFCGGTEIRLCDTGAHWATCEHCTAEGPVFDTEAEAIAAWNTRAALPKDGLAGRLLAVSITGTSTWAEVEALCAEAAAALSAAPAVDGWRPISEAPKDGTPLIVGVIADGQLFDVDHGQFEVVPEDEDDGPWDIRDGEPWCSYVGRSAGTYFNYWLPGKEWETRWRVTADFPYTHYMPLPSPPHSGESENG